MIVFFRGSRVDVGSVKPTERSHSIFNTAAIVIFLEAVWRPVLIPPQLCRGSAVEITVYT
jgi:hypothetical protein